MECPNPEMGLHNTLYACRFDNKSFEFEKMIFFKPWVFFHLPSKSVSVYHMQFLSTRNNWVITTIAIL